MLKRPSPSDIIGTRARREPIVAEAEEPIARPIDALLEPNELREGCRLVLPSCVEDLRKWPVELAREPTLSDTRRRRSVATFCGLQKGRTQVGQNLPPLGEGHRKKRAPSKLVAVSPSGRR
tara:strand:+ start:128 stop:490 length:363 start_codon:yes stop_codon:yes gene_type:complete